MTHEVRYFMMKLSINMLHKCLQGASFGKVGEDISKNLRIIEKGLSHAKAFENKKLLVAVMDSQETISELAEKLADGDWEQLCLVINLIGEVTAGNVLVVEKEQYDGLVEKHEEELNNIPQI
jgi:hypothetical protein